jgi:prepilin signal peptidase PulO-like enzyme (type II secretory pathway)
MDLFILFFIFAFGASIGSFLNVVLYRFNTGLTLGGRSMCATCARTLEPYELVPVVSFLALGARCRTCKSKISWQYPVIEIANGCIAVVVYLMGERMEFDSGMIYAAWLLGTFAIHTILLGIIAYDIKHTIIPDTFSALFAAIAIGMAIASLPTPSGEGLLQIFLAGFALAFPFAFLWFISKGKWMGFGDAKLAIGIGWYLGFSLGIASILMAFWLGAIVGVLLMVLTRITGKLGLNMKSELPFAPFLIVGLWIAWIGGISVGEILGVFERLFTI